MAEADEMNQYPNHNTPYQQRHPRNPAYLGQKPILPYTDVTTTTITTTSWTQPSNLSPAQIRDPKYPLATLDSPMIQSAPSPSVDQDVLSDHDRDDTHYTSSSAATTSFTSLNRISDSTGTTSLSALDESPAPSQLPSPHWDSLAHNMPLNHDYPATSSYNHDYPATSTYNHDYPAASTYNYDSANAYAYEHSDSQHLRSNSLASEARDEFPPLRSPITTTFDTRYPTGGEPTSPRSVSNFSRPRNANSRPSSRQIHEDARAQPPNQYRSESSRPDHSLNHTTSVSSWPRERGQSISSNQSASTFASLPVRPSHDLYSESFRTRSRQLTSASSRPPVAYNRNSYYNRDGIHRMASLPSEELRSSYRSHQSASTAQGTMLTETSSVLSKRSSFTSLYGAGDMELYGAGEIDEDFSVEDVMGMYERGFEDTEPEDNNNNEDNGQDNDSRPPTASSEARRRTIVLEAMTGPPPIPPVGEMPPPVVRNSAFMLRSSRFPAHPLSAADISEILYPNEKLNASARHDSDGMVNDDSAGEDDDNRGGNGSGGEDGEGQGDEDEDGHRDEGGDAEFQKRKSTRRMTNMTLTMDADRDRYGFRKQSQYVTMEQYDQWNEGYTEYLVRRKAKWAAFQKENGLMSDSPNRFPPRSAKTKRFIRKGIPPDWRGAAWWYYAGGPAILSKHSGLYDELLKREVKDVDVEAIERDLHRTFPDNIKFRSTKSSPNVDDPRKSRQSVKNLQNNGRRPETAMVSSLRRVLHAFAIYNPRIGYCQSLNFLAGLLLLFVESEEYAFWLLNVITRVHLPGTHEVSLEGANVDLGVLMSSLKESLPAVWAKIGGELDGTDAVRPSRSRRTRNKQPEPTRLPPITLCMTAWFMSCFVGTLPIESTLRVWDVFFYEGSKTLFRVAMAIFKVGEAEIRAVGDPMEIFQVVQTIPRRLVDANALIELCFKRRNGFGHISQDTVDLKRQNRRRQVHAEKDKDKTGGGGAGDAEEVASAAAPESDIRRKATLWGRRRERPHPAEAM